MFNKERLTLIALTLVALLLAGCGLFGPKSFDIVVRIEPPVEGVKILVDGVHRTTTEADGQVELKVKANAKLTAELEGYTFKQKELKVTEDGEYVFEIETSPGRKGAIVSVKTVLEDIQVWAGETPFEDLDLPSTVEVVLDDDEEVEVAVDWTAAEEDYDYETAGVYELEGVLVPGEGITNPDNITAKVKVVVEDKGPYDGAKDYLAGFFADYEEIGPDVDKLTLPTEIDLGDGVTAKVTWASSNPEVLREDGTINRTAEDVEVTLTGTITIEQAGPEGQAEEDPTVFTITVTVLADPKLKAEALVEELEAIDGPKHYSEVADILKLIEDAKEAVEAITGNPALRNELRLRVLGVESKVNETLEGHVQAVLGGAIGESGNPLKLFDALKAFWDAEEQYKQVYWYMVKFMGALEGINHDAIEPSDVDIIQEELIEKAPQVDAERLIVWEIVWAAKMTELPGSLSQFKGVLQQHADLFQRLNLEDDDDEYTVLNKYADFIVEFAFPPVSATLDHIQLAIDVANWEAFLDALGDAFDSVERDDLDRAEILFSYLTEDEVLLDKLGTPLPDIPDEEDGVMAYFAGLMAHLDLLLDIFEAETSSELWAALHAEGVEFEYLYEKLAEGYLREIGTKYEGKAQWGDADDFEDRLEQIEGIIQGAINAVNTENLKVILAKFGEFKEEDHEDALWALLIELDLATPVASVEYPTEALDLDLEDPETGFDPDKLPFYKDALLGLGNLPDKAEDINDVDASFKQIVGIIAQETLNTTVCSTDGRLKFRALI
ncbi:Ig-like domain-containing protein [Candidatus Darwinibacter acetoxidans]